MGLQLLRTKMSFIDGRFLQKVCNQSIPIYVSIVIVNRYQSMYIPIFAWIVLGLSISVNRLIIIDFHRVSILAITYPGGT